jgi:predicted DNA-binding transcriptional regulator AlpA
LPSAQSEPGTQFAKLIAGTGDVAQMLGCSPSTVTRLWKTDPLFPQPFRMGLNGDLKWAVAGIPAYIATKAARAQAGEQPIGSPAEERSGARPNSARRPRTKPRPYRAGMAGDADAGEAA